MNNIANAPLLLSIKRGPIIECAHRGLVAVFDGEAQLVKQWGDIDTLVHTRSTAKPFQILPLLKISPLKPEDLVLFMSSHAGDDLHTSRLEQILHEFAWSKNQLKCGIHPPQSQQALFELLKHHKQASVLHNNCSGKHTAMLILCHKLKLDPNHYTDLAHPIQNLIKAELSRLADLDSAYLSSGIDGCCMPSFCLPLKNLAIAYARLSYWQDKELAAIREALTQYPEYLAGHGRFDTELIKASRGAILSKSGADGIHALAIRPNQQFTKGLGVVIKIADGDAKQNIRPALIKSLLNQWGLWPKSMVLENFLPATKNYQGQDTSTILSELE